MSRSDLTDTTASVVVENIGGISKTEVDLPSGVTLLTGRNATNRTSFLQAIMAAVGSTDVSLKGDADAGRVELVLNGDTYHRTLRRSGSHVGFDGDPYLEDSTVADLFAFLLESNDARRAVIRGDDLRDLLMRPVDTEEIRAEIDRLESERETIEEQLDDLESLKKELPSLEERKHSLESEVDSKRAELADIEEAIESMDVDINETREEKRELESRLEELRDLRTDLEEVRSDIDLEENSLASLRSDRSDLQERKESLPDSPAGESEHIEREYVFTPRPIPSVSRRGGPTGVVD